MPTRCGDAQDLMGAVGTVDHPFMKPGHEGAPKGMMLMTADKGLAGAFNSNVIRAGEQLAREDAASSGIPSATRRATRSSGWVARRSSTYRSRAPIDGYRARASPRA